MAWPIVTVGGVDYYQFDGEILVPVAPDPLGQVASIILRPSGGAAGVGVPAIEKGDPGDAPILSTITVTELAYDDPTSASATWTLVDPDPVTYTLALSLHAGEPGDPGYFAAMDATDITGTPLVGKILVVNTEADGFEYAAQKVGDRYSPTTINNVPSGQAGYTVCTVGIPAQPFAWRPRVSAGCVITGTGADVRADLIAYLGTDSGNIVGRGFGTVGVNASGIETILAAGPPPNSNDAYDKVAANTGTTIYLRVERQSGGDTFTTSATTTWCNVWVQPVP